MKITISKEGIIGIPFDKCLVCGEQFTNRHHVIPICLKPKYNVTIPLCDKHKDCLHPIIKQKYFPKELRNKIGKLARIANDLNGCVSSLRKDIQFHHSPSSVITSEENDNHMSKKYD